jgi:hypothetical protein
MRLQTSVSESRGSERGAALVTAIMLSLLLLAAGGTLILTATMTGITARDSTAEMQAYYAAEAGVARTLQVIRGNVESNPTGTRATFHNILCTPTLWTATSGNVVNVSTDGVSRFQVTEIMDPDNYLNKVAKCAEGASYKPDRLRIRVRGLGVRDSMKNMEIVVDRYTLDYPVDSVITGRNDSATPMSFILGDSNVTTISGEDIDSGNSIAAVAVNDGDYQTVNNVIDGCDPDGSNCGNGPNVVPADPTVLTSDNTPSFLETVAKAREFLYGPEGLEQVARNEGRYFTSGPAAIASTEGLGANSPDGVFTFVDGDLILEGKNPVTGQGTLVVTGKLTLHGNFQWNGIILVLGQGEILRDGAGQGDIFGALFIAKFSKTGADTDLFQSPIVNTNGGGSANIQYSSNYVDMAKAVGGHAVKGVREY